MSKIVEDMLIRAGEATIKRIADCTTFNEVFLMALEEMIKEMSHIFLTEKQLELIEDSRFFNSVPHEEQTDTAIVLIYLLDSYNRLADGMGWITYLPRSKHDMDTMRKHTATVDRFKAMLEDQELFIYTKEDVYARLKADVKVLSDAINKAMITKPELPNKKDIKEFINDLCDEFKIKKGNEFKTFINTFDKE